MDKASPPRSARLVPRRHPDTSLLCLRPHRSSPASPCTSWCKLPSDASVTKLKAITSHSLAPSPLSVHEVICTSRRINFKMNFRATNLKRLRSVVCLRGWALRKHLPLSPRYTPHQRPAHDSQPASHSLRNRQHRPNCRMSRTIPCAPPSSNERAPSRLRSPEPRWTRTAQASPAIGFSKAHLATCLGCPPAVRAQGYSPP